MGLPYIEPLTFLSLRFSIAALILISLLPMISVKWPVQKIEYLHSAVAGVLIQAVYLGGVFSAISLGIGAGLSALIVGLQPLLTVLLALLFLGERLTMSKTSGIALGLTGLALVVFERSWGSNQEVTAAGVLFCLFALIGISLGTIYQKRFCTNTNLLAGAIIQYSASVFVLLPMALYWESNQIAWTGEFIFALGWLVLILSLGAVFLLMILIRAGEAGKVASLFYLVPPVVAVEAWFLFDEPLTWLIAFGILLCITGVWLVVRKADNE